jgi:hypothetical protein
MYSYSRIERSACTAKLVSSTKLSDRKLDLVASGERVLTRIYHFQVRSVRTPKYCSIHLSSLLAEEIGAIDRLSVPVVDKVFGQSRH